MTVRLPPSEELVHKVAKALCCGGYKDTEGKCLRPDHCVAISRDTTRYCMLDEAIRAIHAVGDHLEKLEREAIASGALSMPEVDTH